jgi:hypothetical protein
LAGRRLREALSVEIEVLGRNLPWQDVETASILMTSIDTATTEAGPSRPLALIDNVQLPLNPSPI